MLKKSTDTIIITAADTKFFELVQGTILSIRDKSQGKQVAIGFLDLGCTAEEIKWLQEYVDIIKQPCWDFDFPSREQSPEYLKGLLARPFLRQYFPGFDVYLWIDADAWVQDWFAIELFIQGANRKGLAISPELDRSSCWLYGRQITWGQFKAEHYENFFGNSVAEKLRTYPILNAGVFALHRNAPHWQIWEELLRQGLQNCANFLTDQFALNFAIYEHDLFTQTELLPTWYNWLFQESIPTLDCNNFYLVEPYLPHTPIGILHLAGSFKEYEQLRLPTTTSGIVTVSIYYLAFKQQRERVFDFQDRTKNFSLPLGDYVSQGFTLIYPDLCLPNIVPRNSILQGQSYQYNQYVDQRYPGIPLLSRDEALILYNLALKYKSKQGLVIGAQMGWSLCHMAIAGLELDVIDPILGNSEILQDITASINSAKEVFGTIPQITLVPGSGSSVIEELGTQLQRRWSLIFIDSSLDVSSALAMAIACEKYTEPNAMIVFQNLVSQDVYQGFNYLKQKGWQTRIYQTVSIIGVAWRGKIEPVNHQSDPQIAWELPKHLENYVAIAGD
jgi:lipopolysaccharide biosynthesis glycosyltransferase